MKTLISFCLFFILSINSISISQSGWAKQRSFTVNTLIGIYFINDNTGWVVGNNGVICTTTNGGTNWVNGAYGQGGTLVSLYFKDQNTGIIGGYNVSHLAGFIIKTTNNGNSWSRQDFNGEPYDIFSFGGDTIWSSRHDGYVMRSYNLGNTWTSTFVHQNLELYTVYFINNLTGWTGGAVYQGLAYIYKTTNGGISWFNQFINSSNHFYGIYFINEQTGFAATLNGCIYQTTDSGTNWLLKLSGINNVLFKIKFPSLNTGYAVGNIKTIIKTTNTGANWTVQLLPSNITSFITFNNVLFRSITLGWAIGDSGIIVKTTNGGEPLGIQYLGNEIVEEYRLSQNYPNPFNPTTAIEFDLAKTTNAKLSIYDLTGKEIEILVNEDLKRGSYRVNYNAFNLSSGVYYYKLITNDFAETKKLVLLK